ncbi:MAG: catalase HPII [Pseudomonadota bacterium]
MAAKIPANGKSRTPASAKSSAENNDKLNSLEQDRTDGAGAVLTTNQGVPIADNQNSLRAGVRGPSLLEDFILREKITHFDHERIPERIVHARGEAAHGFFQVYESMAKYTRAGFLQDPSVKTPVFARFSTVAGSRGSADTVRDARGFAVKFYTQEGNFDLVGNNIPVFFIQDAMKFPDLVHAIKPEPNNEMPQASSAHDTFWDFVSLVPETTHMVMWVMSDRAIPRSLRMMEGFGVHTFRFVTAEGVSSFVKFHWKPLLGVHGLAWDEAQKLAGKDADFHRRDLWEAIEAGDFPEWELGVQIIPEEDEFKFGFDLLDPTKLVPEELVPVTRIGKMTLNRNPDNFFAEVEQAAFHPGHVVPGIDFTNDPLLQGRLFSYTDTQLIRLGGPNFHQLPINRAISPMHNNQRDGLHQQSIPKGRVAYEPNSIANGDPKEAPPEQAGYVSYPERVDGAKVRVRSESFADHFSQARLFWLSQSAPEQDHIVSAYQFELSKVEVPAIVERMLGNLARVDETLAKRVADHLAMAVPALDKKMAAEASAAIVPSPALSMLNAPKDGIKTRKVAILAADGVDGKAIAEMKAALQGAGAMAKVIAPHMGTLRSTSGDAVAVDHTITTMPSIAFDAVFVPGGEQSIATLRGNGDAVHFVLEAFKHCKAIAAVGEGSQMLASVGIPTESDPGIKLPDGIITAAAASNAVAQEFIKAIAEHRFWTRAGKDAVPA